MKKFSSKPIKAAEEEVVDEVPNGEALFEVQDVVDLVSEITGEDVTAEAEDDGSQVTFIVGEDEYVVDAEEDAEEVVSATKAKKKEVKSSRKVVASKKRSEVKAGRVVRRIKR